jgi:predicted nucleic acid-binding protein
MRSLPVYLIDTNVISEARKARANRGVLAFFKSVDAANEPIYLSAITISELRRGIGLIRHRGDFEQATVLENWLTTIVSEFADRIPTFDAEAAQVRGRLRVLDPNNTLDKQIAAIALVNDMTVVTRNTKDFEGKGLSLIKPFYQF